MTRIIAGRWAGHRLAVPARGTRPTSDRVREALMSSADHELGGFTGVHVLDLFAGSGALGIECLSRGAAHAVFVESAAGAASILRKNLAALDGASGEVVLSDAAVWLRGTGPNRPPTSGFDLVIADPPYSYPQETLAEVLRALVDNTLLAPSALLVVERDRRSPQPLWPSSVEPGRSRRYGDTTLWYGRAEE